MYRQKDWNSNVRFNTCASHITIFSIIHLCLSPETGNSHFGSKMTKTQYSIRMNLKKTATLITIKFLKLWNVR